MSVNANHPELKSGEIAGVAFRVLKTFNDNRGFFREALRLDDPTIDAPLNSAWPHRLQVGQVLDWQIDHDRTGWWYVPSGRVVFSLYDARPDSATTGTLMQIELDEVENARVVRIPAGVAYSSQALAATHLVQFSARVPNAQPVQILAADHPARRLNFGN